MESLGKASEYQSTVAECNKIIEELNICVHESGPFKRVIRGACNALSMEADKCRTLLWKIQQKENFEKSQAMKRKSQENLRPQQSHK